jgi:hypothetical protein
MPEPHVRVVRGRRSGRALAITAVLSFMILAVGATGAQAATSFTIAKQSDPAGDTTPFTFHVTFTPHPGDTPPAGYQAPADFQLAGGQSRTFTVHKGFYTVKELTLAGWRLASITCTTGGDPDPADAAKIDLGASSAKIELSSNENKSCTFRNAKVVAPAGPAPAGGSAPAQGSAPAGSAPTAGSAPSRQGVLGEQAVRAAARLSAPSSCVSRRYTVSVAAGRVASVAFFVNGRRVRTMTARPGQRRFSVQLPRPQAQARVIARVRFRANTSPATRTLRATIRRCAQQAVRPQFTG